MAELSANGRESGEQYVDAEDQEFLPMDLDLNGSNELFGGEQAEMDDFQPCNDYVGQIQQKVDDHLNRYSPAAGAAVYEAQENDFNLLQPNQMLNDERFEDDAFDFANSAQQEANWHTNDLQERQTEQEPLSWSSGSVVNNLADQNLEKANDAAPEEKDQENAGFEQAEELSSTQSADQNDSDVQKQCLAATDSRIDRDSTNTQASAGGIELEHENGLQEANEGDQADRSAGSDEAQQSVGHVESDHKEPSEPLENSQNCEAAALENEALQEARRMQAERRKEQAEDALAELSEIKRDFALLKENLNSALVVFPDISELFESAIARLREDAARRLKLSEACADETAARMQRQAVQEEMTRLVCPGDIRELHAAAQQVQDALDRLQQLQRRIPELQATSAAARAESYRTQQMSAQVVTEQADLRLQQAWNTQNLQENAKQIEKLRAKIALLSAEEEDIRKTCDELEDVIALISSQNAEHAVQTRQQCLELNGKYRDIAAGLFSSQISGNISKLEALETQNARLQHEISAARQQKDLALRWTMLFGAGAVICTVFCVLAFIA